jgi:fumarate hydratase class II
VRYTSIQGTNNVAENVRIEKDSLGDVRIPARAPTGAPPPSARWRVYPISGLRAAPQVRGRLRDAQAWPPPARTRPAKAITAQQADAIVKACKEILAGKLRDEFAVDVFQMGAGTSFHMNVNEVLRQPRERDPRREARRLQVPRERQQPRELSASPPTTRIPTAIRLGCLLMLRDHLDEPLLANLEKALRLPRAKEFDKVLKSGRTHLQDAVPIRLGQEFKRLRRRPSSTETAINPSPLRARACANWASAAAPPARA